MIKSDKKNEKSSLSKDENFSKEKDTSKKETVALNLGRYNILFLRETE